MELSISKTILAKSRDVKCIGYPESYDQKANKRFSMITSSIDSNEIKLFSYKRSQLINWTSWNTDHLTAKSYT